MHRSARQPPGDAEPHEHVGKRSRRSFTNAASSSRASRISIAVPLSCVVLLSIGCVAATASLLVAGLWIGSTVFGAVWLMPALDASGASGGQVMARLTRNGYATYMSTIGFTTLVTGIYLLWRFTGGSAPSVAATHAGLAFGIGGAAGILAGIIGGTVVGR